MITPTRMCCIVAPALLLSPLAVAARSPDNPIVVELSAPTKARWVQRVSDDLSMNVRYPLSIGRSADEGVVTVAFRCGPDGRPTDVLIPRSSGSARLDSAAQLAVERLKTLHPLPPELAQDQLFLAKVAFATDDRRMARLLARARKSPAPAMAVNTSDAVTISVAMRD
jgi:TonB family protein